MPAKDQQFKVATQRSEVLGLNGKIVAWTRAVGVRDTDYDPHIPKSVVRYPLHTDIVEHVVYDRELKNP
jgi:hypothetical protein